MTLQIRIVNPNNKNDISTILDRTDNRSYFKSVNSADEGISFEISKTDPKSEMLDPYNEASFTNIWEVWDTKTDKRLNYGPITSIEDAGGTFHVQGAGRSAFLTDHYKSIKTFYAGIDNVIDEIRYENLATAPSTAALITTLNQDSDDEFTIFPYQIDETFYGLSKNSRNFIIDDNEAYIPLGKVEPPRTFTTTSEYWTGMSVEDTIWLDLGDRYPIHKIRLMFPWWGGAQRSSNRTYDFTLNYATSGIVYPDVLDRNWSRILPIFDTNAAWGDSRVVTNPGRPYEFYLGATQSGIGTDYNTINALSSSDTIHAQYIGVHINDVHAWYGNSFDTEAAHDGYDFQCNPDYRPGDDAYFGNKLGIMTYKDKNGVIHPKAFYDHKIVPSNDCHASIVELGVFKEIIERKKILPLARQRIDNNNPQISYYRAVDASETKTVLSHGQHYRKFEPGTFFNKIHVTYSGATSLNTKFYPADCANCYPDGFNFAIVDDQNSMIYHSTSTSQTGISIKSKQNMAFVMMRGAANAVVLTEDAWKGETDPLSWGGSYSYTQKTGDIFVINFRGQSLRWYATIPDTFKGNAITGATVSIELRFKLNFRRGGKQEIITNGYSDWTTLEASYKLPEGVSSEIVYEIPFESGILQPDTVYELRVTLLDDNFCSIDSVEGYWSASMTEYQEDSSRITMSDMSAVGQIDDKRFSGGSMYKWHKPGVGGLITWEGDRAIVTSAKGRHHGKLTILMYYYKDGVTSYDPGVDEHVFIPGGDPDNGSLTIDLDTGSRGQEITQCVIFDTNDYFVDNGGLPWGKYALSFSYKADTAQKYTTDKYHTGVGTFTQRCHECTTKIGTPVTIYEYVYLDSIWVHEKIGISVQFDNQTHLDIVKGVADAIQVEWDASESGLVLEPRIGTDTQYALREGDNVLVAYNLMNDVTKVATRLFAQGSDIDGLPLTALVEDKKTRRLFGRTITRQNDFRETADYMQLIGLGRMELRRRNRPEKRITVTYIGDDLPLVQGDSFMLWTKRAGNIRVRIDRKAQNESTSNGTTFDLECEEWPLIA